MGFFPPHRRIWVLLLILMAGCTLTNTGPANQSVSGAPVVSIGAPSPNATYLEGVVVNIQATVSNAGQDIDRVEIVIDGTTVATLSQPNPEGAATFNVTHGWSASGVGSHSISVIAYRADGSSSSPQSVTISVIANQPTGATGATNAPTLSSANSQTLPTATLAQQLSQPTSPPQPAVPSQPTNPPASPTPSTPTASFSQGVNVRRGPGLVFDPPIGAFAAGQTTDILAVNPAGSWYKVRYGGGEGWVFAALVTAAGDVASLPRDPGPPVPTSTPIPPTQPPPPPATTANLVAGIVELQPGQPVCAQTFNVGLDVANLGNEPTASSGTVSLEDVRSADGSVQQTTIGGYPVLQPQQTFRVNMPLTVSTWYNEEHTIILIIDPNNQIPETNESDNRREVKYTLQKGNCP